MGNTDCVQAKRTCAGQLRVWERSGQPKVTLKCESEEEMLTLLAKVRQRDSVTRWKICISFKIFDQYRFQYFLGVHANKEVPLNRPSKKYSSRDLIPIQLIYFLPVLRIRDVYPRSEFFYLGYRIIENPDPHKRI
jgi:hypothetical protein